MSMARLLPWGVFRIETPMPRRKKSLQQQTVVIETHWEGMPTSWWDKHHYSPERKQQFLKEYYHKDYEHLQVIQNTAWKIIGVLLGNSKNSGWTTTAEQAAAAALPPPPLAIHNTLTSLSLVAQKPVDTSAKVPKTTTRMTHSPSDSGGM